MKVILLKNVKNVGQQGEVVEVSEGHARNFLIPQAVAKIADFKALHALQGQQQAALTRAKVLEKRATGLLGHLASRQFQFEAPGNAAGTLYSGLKESEILSKIKARVPELPETARLVDYEPLKLAGECELKIELMPGMQSKIRLNIKIRAQK